MDEIIPFDQRFPPVTGSPGGAAEASFDRDKY
jgi:hypothetical protein